MTTERKEEILKQAQHNVYKCSNDEYTAIIKEFYGDNPPSGWNRSCSYCRIQKLKFIATANNIK